MKAKHRALSPNRALALGFLAIILAGALLLMLPIANRSGKGLSFLDSLFTATSATCVTGLVGRTPGPSSISWDRPSCSYSSRWAGWDI